VGVEQQARLVPDYVKQVIGEASEVELVSSAPATLPFDPSLPITITVVKNEIDRLPEFFDHYRLLGIERFAVIDNGSTDGSAEFAAMQPDVDFYSVPRRFVWPFKQGWISRAIQTYGLDRWYIYVDADEHMVFDGAPERGINSLVRYAESRGIRRVRGMLVDMYAEGPLLEYSVAENQRLIDAFPLFDSDSYQEFDFKEIISRKGGPRTRCFQTGDVKFNPEMSKYPLFKPRIGDLMANPHHIFPCDLNFDSECFIGLLHFKFLPGFVEKIRVAISEKTYWDGSAEYKQYLKVINDKPDLRLTYSGSARFEGANSLVDAGHIKSFDTPLGAEGVLAANVRKVRRQTQIGD